MEDNDLITSDNYLGLTFRGNKKIKWKKCINIDDGYVHKNKLWPNSQYIKDYPVETDSAQTAYFKVIENAGANIYRDSADTRIIENVKNKTMPKGSKYGVGLIDSQDDVGGWPVLKGTKKQDTDNDGIDDEWEIKNNLNPNKKDSHLISNNGYTNIENYANYLATLKHDEDEDEL